MLRIGSQRTNAPIALALAAACLPGCSSAGSAGGGLVSDDPITTSWQTLPPEAHTGVWRWVPDAPEREPVMFEAVFPEEHGFLLQAETEGGRLNIRVTIVEAEQRSYAILRTPDHLFRYVAALPLPADARTHAVLPMRVDEGRVTPLIPPVWLVYAATGFDRAGTMEVDPGIALAAAEDTSVVLQVLDADDAMGFYETKPDDWFEGGGTLVRTH